MPANLPPQYYELEREFSATRDPREKLRLAEELLRIMPKHKGTSKLQADMKQKISKLRKEIESPQKQPGARQVPTHDHIEKEGAGQVILIGPPNTGKSSLVDILTHAEPMIGDYPYTTREPLTGMMPFETIQIQLIDTPPISPDMFEGFVSNLIRQADLVMLVADLENKNMKADLEFVLSALQEKRIKLVVDPPEEPEDVRFVYKRTMICGHKEYEDESGEMRRTLDAMFPEYPRVYTSILDEESLEDLKKTIFKALRIIRVYTKQVGKDVEMVDPVVLPVGGTVEDAALEIHKDFAHKLKFAKLWGHGKFEGQRITRDEILNDGDIVEFHI